MYDFSSMYWLSFRTFLDLFGISKPMNHPKQNQCAAQEHCFRQPKPILVVLDHNVSSWAIHGDFLDCSLACLGPTFHISGHLEPVWPIRKIVNQELSG